eukprot:4784170-Pleurochrysis_carterae.AAC.6
MVNTAISWSLTAHRATACWSHDSQNTLNAISLQGGRRIRNRAQQCFDVLSAITERARLLSGAELSHEIYVIPVSHKRHLLHMRLTLSCALEFMLTKILVRTSRTD